MPFRPLVVLLVSFVLSVGAGRLLADEKPASDEKPAATEAQAEKAARPELADDAEYYELFKVFADTVDQVERNYVKDVSRRELMEAAIRGVLSKLDPYSNYIGPHDISRFKDAVENQFTGIGIQVDVRRGFLTVVSPIVGSPAYRAGLRAGDVITEIEGKSTEGINIDEAVSRLKGQAGTTVNITVLHPAASESEKVVVTREVIQMETVRGDRHDDNDQWNFMLDHPRKLGYVRIVSFGRDTPRDLKKALDQLKKQDLRGLILDLRFNPGGLLTAAIEVADMFLTEGEIVSTSGRNSPKRSWSAHRLDTFEGFPMAVLVNRHSASASEIVSASLQDHHRAIVIGERTWGKGSVQNVIEMDGGKSILKLTTANYLRPNGHNIHRDENAKESDEWGVKPDEGYEIKLDETERYQLQLYRRDRDILSARPQKEASPTKDDPVSETEKKPTEKPAEAKAPFVDRQLQKAIDYLTSELAKVQ
ncbi:MAG TPA: S41 family peptidase [Pirellulales bacterium]|nr:S41 family peptidase [Pirellulales bacterium]